MFIETRELPVTAPARVGRYHELAEWMRAGAAKTKQCARAYQDPLGRTCAWGAAALGFGIDLSKSSKGLMAFLDQWPENLYNDIVRMNDRGMSREAIADWLCREGGCEHAL